MEQEILSTGRFLKAPENFLNQDGIKSVFSEAKNGRRDFIRRAFAAAAASAAIPTVVAQSNSAASEDGDLNILNLPEHSKGLGQGVSPNRASMAPIDASDNLTSNRLTSSSCTICRVHRPKSKPYWSGRLPLTQRKT